MTSTIQALAIIFLGLAGLRLEAKMDKLEREHAELIREIQKLQPK